ncbi:MAG: amidohydrolase family protein [Deltaproteobacteria bacterium]|nr:amidohydrolase family protein [Deltaproteobacteria bacterium]
MSAVIDVHTHVFPPEIIQKREDLCKKDIGFSILYGKKNIPIADIHSITQYMESQGIDYAAVLSFPFKDRGLLSMCNDYVLSVAQGKNLLPFIMIDVWDESWSMKEIDRCFSKGAKGVGEVSFYGGRLGKNEFQRLNRFTDALREKGGILLIHVNEQLGHSYNGKINVDFNSLYKFIEENRGLKIVLAHLGGGVCFYEFMPEVKKAFENVFYDTAAVPYLFSAEVYTFVQNHLSQKVLFGSDFPLLSYSRYTRGLSTVKEEARELILYKNAQKLFNLNWER